MRVLLDTHILLWALGDSARLSPRALEILADAGNECWVSSATVWEIAIKVSIGKYRLKFPMARLESAIVQAGFSCLNVSIRHALALEHVETPHTDPFDRLLIAQCEVETLRLLTADRLLIKLPIAVRS